MRAYMRVLLASVLDAGRAPRPTSSGLWREACCSATLTSLSTERPSSIGSHLPGTHVSLINDPCLPPLPGTLAAPQASGSAVAGKVGARSSIMHQLELVLLLIPAT